MLDKIDKHKICWTKNTKYKLSPNADFALFRWTIYAQGHGGKRAVTHVGEREAGRQAGEHTDRLAGRHARTHARRRAGGRAGAGRPAPKHRDPGGHTSAALTSVQDG